MVLNVNTNLGIAKQSTIAPKSAEIVKGDELTKVTQDILTATPIKRADTTVKNGLRVFTPGAEVSVAKQTAVNRAGFNVNISLNAQQSIETLKAQAAQSHFKSLTKAVDGKIHTNTERTDFSELKSSLGVDRTKDVEIFQSANLDKDRKGSGGFYMPHDENEESNQEGLNLLA